MNINFVTGNRHKVDEAKIALKGSNVHIQILEADKREPDEWKLEEVATKNAKRIADETGKVVMIEDTGIYFEAFDDFPGSKPKRYFDSLGYAGLLAKFKFGQEDEVKSKKAHFKTVIGLCEPGEEPILFTGELQGTITNEIKGMDADVLPYERIFVCEDGRYLFEYPREEKNLISHRGKAFRKLKEFLDSK